MLYGSQDATLYALDAETGKEAWKFTIQDQIRCSPTVVENRAFIAGCDGKLHVVDLDNGAAAEGVKIDGPTGATPAVLGDLVYFGSEGGTFYAINWKTAQVAWSQREPRGQPLRSSAAVIEGLVVFGGRDKQLHAVAPSDGRKLWSFASKGRIDSSPVIVGDRVFVGSSDGRVFAFDRRSGEMVWQYEAGGDFAASPALASGRLVIGTRQGALYCFGTKISLILPGQPVARSLQYYDTRRNNHVSGFVGIRFMATETAKTEVGSYFISNYPPFSHWSAQGARRCPAGT